MNRLEQEFEGKVDFHRLNVGDPELEAIQQSYDMRGHPTSVILNREGDVSARFFGVQTAEQLRPVLEEVFAGDK